jgi:hypothetical protein
MLTPRPPRPHFWGPCLHLPGSPHLSVLSWGGYCQSVMAQSLADMKLEQQNGHVEMLTAWGVGTLLHHSPRPLVGGRDMTHASRYLVSHWAAWLLHHWPLIPAPPQPQDMPFSIFAGASCRGLLFSVASGTFIRQCPPEPGWWRTAATPSRVFACHCSYEPGTAAAQIQRHPCPMTWCSPVSPSPESSTPHEFRAYLASSYG